MIRTADLRTTLPLLDASDPGPGGCGCGGCGCGCGTATSPTTSAIATTATPLSGAGDRRDDVVRTAPLVLDAGPHTDHASGRGDGDTDHTH